MKQPRKVYLDTSVVGAYYDARDGQRRQLTLEFWGRLTEFSCYVSSLVLDELGAVGSRPLRDKLLNLVSAFPVLSVTHDASNLARAYIEAGIVVETYHSDAMHLAIASVNSMDYLVSWNFRHIVNVRTRGLVNSVNTNNSLRALEIVAPPELR